MAKEKKEIKRKSETIITIISACIILIMITVIIMVGINQPQKTKRALTNQTEENIKFDNKKTNVYFFYGDGCPHCEELINFLNNLPEKYNKYFDLYTMEVWYNEENNKLMEDLVTELGEKVEGVPCLIIGNQVFFGYSTSMDQELKKAIKEEYEKMDKFDVYQQYNSKA